MDKDKAEVARMLDVLRTLSRMLGISNREVERRLNLHPSFLTRLYGQQVEAKLEVVLGIARALGLEYTELFDLLYPERPTFEEASPAARRIRNMLEGLQPAKIQAGAVPGPPPHKTPETGSAPDPEAFKAAVREVLQEIFEKRQAGTG